MQLKFYWGVPSKSEMSSSRTFLLKRVSSKAEVPDYLWVLGSGKSNNDAATFDERAATSFSIHNSWYAFA
jgi:hypothetical protein